MREGRRGRERAREEAAVALVARYAARLLGPEAGEAVRACLLEFLEKRR